MRSSLNRDRTDALPRIYRRPQINPSIVFGFGGRDGAGNPMPKRKTRIEPVRSKLTGRLSIPESRDGLVEVEIVSRAYDNPEISDTQWKNGKLEWADRYATYTNHGLAADFVVKLNHPHRRDASAAGRAAKAFMASLVEFNVCWRCRQPITVKKACVPRGATEEQMRDERNWLTRKTRKGGISVFNKQGKKEFSYPRQAVEYNTTSEVKNITYAQVKPYFDVKINEHGKYYYFLVDGTGIKKGVRETTGTLGTRKFKKLEYFVLDTGETCKNYVPPTSFRVFHVECGCKLKPDQRS